ncbi:LPS assembly lipoprotein LptE [Dongia soli]|uniref:LPS assembly lipoprotein LptE n=1 Tax=Dongia soli TaxID=600628 RepID=A0ABU5E6Y8_9PROT|nr:LPS assembly lipoprotein LptE [Dongia soli]MDY0881948.1 LPS assembly lipoprotein LptE [Dongia soli]
MKPKIEQPVNALRRRCVTVAAALVFGSIALAGCGFRPMYGEAAGANTTGGIAGTKLAQIRIDPIADRIGQELHNRLRDRMNPSGQPDVAAYSLSVTLSQTEQEIAGDTDENVRHKILKVTAVYSLIPTKDDKQPLLNNTSSRISVSFDTLDDPYNDIATKEDAERRAVEQLADMITTRIAVYFTSHPEI